MTAQDVPATAAPLTSSSGWGGAGYRHGQPTAGGAAVAGMSLAASTEIAS